MDAIWKSLIIFRSFHWWLSKVLSESIVWKLLFKELSASNVYTTIETKHQVSVTSFCKVVRYFLPGVKHFTALGCIQRDEWARPSITKFCLNFGFWTKHKILNHESYLNIHEWIQQILMCSQILPKRFDLVFTTPKFHQKSCNVFSKYRNEICSGSYTEPHQRTTNGEQLYKLMNEN